MKAVLGIDAAWTKGEPSGIAVLVSSGTDWQRLCVAPSYLAFLSLFDGHTVSWQTGRIVGCEPDVRALPDSAHKSVGAVA